MINWFKKNVNALSLGAMMAVLPLIGDIAWWYRDYILGEWTWHLAFILCMFVVSIIGSTIAMIWYHKTKNNDRNYVDIWFKTLMKIDERTLDKLKLQEKQIEELKKQLKGLDTKKKSKK